MRTSGDEIPRPCTRLAMALVGALAARLLAGRRGFQESQDVWQLYHLLHYYQQCGGREVRVARPQRVSFKKQFTAVHAAVTEQVIKLLTLRRAEADHPSYEEGGTAELQGSSHGQRTGCSGADLLRVDCLPFNLYVPELPSSGDPIPGVQVCGHAVPGTVLCFFPGTVYLPPHLSQMPHYPEVTRDNPYLMSRTDGSIIDAKDYRMEAGRHPLALAHLLRHPPRGGRPNVMPFSYDVPSTFPQELLPLIPNRYYKSPSFLYSRKCSMRTLVLVAMAHIKDEELFLNYRLHPDSKLPDWYCSVDATDDQRRWKYF